MFRNCVNRPRIGQHHNSGGVMASSASDPSTSSERVFIDSFSKWIQTIGIIIAAGWGVYTFIYKEIKVPTSAPINISVNMQLKKVGTGKPKGKLVAVEMRVSATNPSPRKVYLLPSAWMVWGIQMSATEPADDDYKQITDMMNAQQADYVNRYTNPQSQGLVAGGSLFMDQVLNPNETVTRTVIFCVPREKYDLLEAHTRIPTSSVQGVFSLQWDYNPDKNSEYFRQEVYLIDKNGRQQPLSKGKGGYSDDRLQEAGSNTELSMWE
jgi:hypothetical protein